MNEIGKILEIDPKLLGDINAIGAAIDGIANAAETTAGRYKTAFTSMVGDTDGLLGKLREVNDLLKTMGIDMTQPLSKGLNEATNAANQAAGAITQAAAAVGECYRKAVNRECQGKDQRFGEKKEKRHRNTVPFVWFTTKYARYVKLLHDYIDSICRNTLDYMGSNRISFLLKNLTKVLSQSVSAVLSRVKPESDTPVVHVMLLPS